MRALILRRVGLLESGGGGPVIVGRADDGDVLRLAGFLRRNGHPHRSSIPTADACARDADRALPHRCRRSCRSCSARTASCCATRARTSSPAASAWSADRSGPRSTTSRSSAPGPAGLAAAVYAGVRRALGARARLPRLRRPGRRVGADRELSRLSDRHHRHGADGARLQPGAEVRRRDGDPGRGRQPRARATARTARFALALGQRRDGARAHRRDRERRALPPARRRQPRRSSRASCVHYWASPLEARLCAGQEVALVGAGNSAGQAVVYLASQVQKVWLLVRGAEPRGEHVALSGRAHRGAAQHRGADADARSTALEGDGRRAARRSAGARRAGEETRRADPPPLPVHRRRAEHRLAGGLAASRSTPRASSAPAPTGDGPHDRSRPAARRLRDRRRARRLGQARRRRGRRRRAGGRRAARLPRRRPAPAPVAMQVEEIVMADECKHADGIRGRDAERARLRGMPEDGIALGASAAVPDLRPCRLLRRLAEPPRHRALPRDRPSDHRGLRSAGRLGLVLRRRDRVRPADRATPQNGPIPRYV